MKRITIGFIPLTDAAPLIAAHERGFAAEEGLSFDLVREVISGGTASTAALAESTDAAQFA